ncbi:MAG: HDOD domain-containing protein [Terracidiphilus sp.]|jgi:EAL and modified HD-GYP domain-containing signal transduction protein
MPAHAQTLVNATPVNTVPEPDLAIGMRYVARQPILDLRGKVHGYELLFRDGPRAVFRGDGDLATRTMIDNTVLFGLGRLTGNLPGFLNCTEEALTGRLVHVLPSGMTVLEILETLDPSPALVSACQHLKACGYRLALDDFTWKPGIEPLVEIADYIKVDFALSDEQDRRELLRRLRGITVALIAEKVETEEEYLKARDEGFTLMQGYYFCRPVLMRNHKVPANRLLHVEILRMLQDDTMDLHELAGLVRRDTCLTYRLLRLINSPVCAMRQEVQSVQAALIAVGEESFRRLATLAITSEMNAGQPMELLRMAFVRGRFCELASVFCDLSHTEQYLLGLLSLLPAMLRVPMHELSPLLPLRDEIRQALEGTQAPERALLSWLEGHEQGDWAACDTVVERRGLNPNDLLLCYEDALQWAEDALHFA